MTHLINLAINLTISITIYAITSSMLLTATAFTVAVLVDIFVLTQKK